jgi:hypothetical protein
MDDPTRACACGCRFGASILFGMLCAATLVVWGVRAWAAEWRLCLLCRQQQQQQQKQQKLQQPDARSLVVYSLVLPRRRRRRFGTSPSWLRMDGRRVFYVYDSYHIPPAQWAAVLKDRAKSGLAGGGPLSGEGERETGQTTGSETTIASSPAAGAALAEAFVIGLWLERDGGKQVRGDILLSLGWESGACAGAGLVLLVAGAGGSGRLRAWRRAVAHHIQCNAEDSGVSG